MALLIGMVLALAVGVLATTTRLDRDRSFYPTVTMVIASYYALFAAMGNSQHALLVESISAAIFFVMALAGFRLSLWLVVAALVAHGFFDLIHQHVIANPGVPRWWPQFCLAYDLTAAAFLAWLLRREKVQAAT
jgi:hypothetical protein